MVWYVLLCRVAIYPLILSAPELQEAQEVFARYDHGGCVVAGVETYLFCRPEVLVEVEFHSVTVLEEFLVLPTSVSSRKTTGGHHGGRACFAGCAIIHWRGGPLQTSLPCGMLASG